MMPDVLQRFLSTLPFADAGLIAEWLDETPDATLQMVATIEVGMLAARYSAAPKLAAKV